MSISNLIHQLPDNVKQSIYNKFNDTFEKRAANLIKLTIDEPIWIESDPSICDHQARFRQFLDNVQSTLQTSDNGNNFWTFIDFMDIEYIKDNIINTFPMLTSKVREFFSFIDQVHRQASGQGPVELVKLAESVKNLESGSLVLRMQVININEMNGHAQFANNNPDNHLALQELAKQLQSVIELLASIPQQIADVINVWKKAFRLSLLAYPFDNYLDQLEFYFEKILTIINENMQLLNGTNVPAQMVVALNEQLQTTTVMILQMSLVVENQPYLYNTNHKTIKQLTVRFLFGDKLAGNCPIGDLSLKLTLQDSMARLNKKPNKEWQLTKVSLDLAYNTRIELDPVEFDESEIRGVGAERVTEQLYVMIFEFRMIFNGRPLIIRQVTEPLVIIKNTSQKMAAESCIYWTYHGWPTGLGDRDSAPAMEVLAMVDAMFANKFGRGLTDTNKKFLLTKLVPNDNLDHLTDQISKISVTRGSIFRITRSANSCAPIFWEWIYSAHELVNNCFADMWKDGLIMGFVSKPEIEVILRRCPPKTVILKFSESGVCVAYLDEEEDRSLEHLNPFKAVHMTNGTKLADLLRNCRNAGKPDYVIMEHLYTADGRVVAKEDALKNYYSQTTKKKGYSGVVVQTVILK